MTREQRLAWDRLRDVAESDDDFGGGAGGYEEDVLHGHAPAYLYLLALLMLMEIWKYLLLVWMSTDGK